MWQIFPFGWWKRSLSWWFWFVRLRIPLPETFAPPPLPSPSQPTTTTPIINQPPLPLNHHQPPPSPSSPHLPLPTLFTIASQFNHQIHKSQIQGQKHVSHHAITTTTPAEFTPPSGTTITRNTRYQDTSISDLG